MTLKECYSKIYTLAFITRYSNRIRINDEDVAQHSFFVAAILLKLHEVYEFDLGKALLAAISHDITESDLSDVTYDIRQKYPEISDSIRHAEKQEVKLYPEAAQEGYNIFMGDTVEGTIANLADAIQVSQYANSELSLGNSTMVDVLTSSRQRVAALKEVLKPYERNK